MEMNPVIPLELGRITTAYALWKSGLADREAVFHLSIPPSTAPSTTIDTTETTEPPDTTVSTDTPDTTHRLPEPDLPHDPPSGEDEA